MDRKEFLRLSGLASASLLVPNFLKAFTADPKSVYKGRVLVIVQLSGGNDGLNTVAPYGDDIYNKLRPTLGLKKKELLPFNSYAGLNSNAEGLMRLHDNGLLGVLNSVGYPNPNRSHFRSMDIWHSASDANAYVQTGWIGRLLDSTCTNNCDKPYYAVELDDSLSLALKGEKVKGIAMRNPETINLASGNKIVQSDVQHYSAHDDDHHNVEYLHKTLTETAQSADYLYKHSKVFKSKRTYPDHDFGRQMKMVAELIGSGSETLIYYVSISTFDTHALQAKLQGKLLKIYADAVKTFFDDMKEAQRQNDVLVMTFSEFGRRVKQNASFGTDHGTANNIFFSGGGLKQKGLINAMPDLTNLVDGDLVYSIDFRSVYATVIQNWLQLDHAAVLGQKFNLLNFV